jgi:WD40 repeat protein/serine/threonine protein kinase/class 3 adenylate cyclase
MFTDIVGSVELQQQFGFDAYSAALDRHNQIFWDLAQQFADPKFIQNTGDGFLAIFPTVASALQCALLFQHAMRTEPWSEVRVVSRVGVHAGEIRFVTDASGNRNIRGLGVSIASRVMSLATGGQILMTHPPFEEGRQSVARHPPLACNTPAPELSWVAHGPYRFKGLKEDTDEKPREVFEVGAKGLAPLSAPPDSKKATRDAAKSDNPMNDWRPAAGVPIPERPGWILERKLGEGGFGDVWLATHKLTKQRRVFKFCYDVALLKSLKNEFRISRRLQTLGKRDDIGIIREVRLDEPPYFLESEWSTEGNIIQWIDNAGGIAAVALEIRIQLVIDVARALGKAHSVGVLHRDIKPANILMNIVDGDPRPQLVDFGIGAVDPAVLKEMSRMTFQQTQDAVNSSGTGGTHRYIPPECSEGREWTTQGDIYSLGVVLYQLVAGDSPEAKWHERASASGWERDIPDELLREDISTCLDKDPTRRPNSAGELADRLTRLPQRRLEIEEQLRAIAEEEEAQAQRRIEQEAAQAQRRIEQEKADQNEKKLRRTQLVLMKLALAVVLGVCILAVWGFNRRGKILDLQSDGEKDRRAARFSGKAMLHLEANDAAAAALWFTQALTERSEKNVRTEKDGHEDDADRRRITCALQAMPRLLGALILEKMNYAEVSPTGDCVFISSRAEEKPASGSGKARNGEARLWFFDGTGAVTLDYPPGVPESFMRAAFAADGNYVAAVTVAGTQGFLHVWSVREGGAKRQPLYSKAFDDPPSDVAFHPEDPDILLVATGRVAPGNQAASGGVIVLNRKTESRLAALKQTLPLNRAIFSPATGDPISSGNRIATAAGDPERGIGECALWNWKTDPEGKTAARFDHRAAVNWLDFSPDGNLLLTASGTQNAAAGEAQIWNLEQGWPIGKPFVHGGAVLMAQFDSFGKRIVTATQRDGKAHIWDKSDPSHPLLTLPHDGNVFSAQWSPDGRFVVTGSRDQKMRVWDAATGAPAAPIMFHAGTVNNAFFTAHGRYLVSGTIGAARLWDFDDRQPKLAPNRTPGTEKVAAISADGKWSAIATELNSLEQRTEILINRIVDGTPRRTLRDSKPVSLQVFVQGSVNHLVFSPDSRLLAIAAQYRPTATEQGGEVLLHELTPGAKSETLPLESAPTFIAFPAGKSTRLLVLGRDTVSQLVTHAMVCNRTGSRIEREFPTTQDSIDCAAISPDGSLIVIGGGSTQPREGFAKIFNVDTGKEVGTVRHDEGVLAVAFDPTGTRLATGSVDDEARVWNLRSLPEPPVRFKHTADVTFVSFLGDGSRLVSGSFDSTAVVWDIAGARQLGACRHNAVVRCAAASSDGAFIVTGGDDRTVRVWDLATYLPIAIFPQSTQIVTVGFSPAADGVFALGFTSPDSGARGILDSVETPARRAEIHRWNFATDARSVKELTTESERLAGREVPKVPEANALDRLKFERWKDVLPPPDQARIQTGESLARYHQDEYARAIGSGSWLAAAWHADERISLLRPPTPNDYLASARAHFRSANWRRVVEQCEQGAGLEPRDRSEAAELRQLRAMALAETVLAIHEKDLFARALAGSPAANAPADHVKAAVEAWQIPLADLLRVENEHRDDAFVLIKLAEILARGGSFAEARSALVSACDVERANRKGARPSPWQRLATLSLLPDPPQLKEYRDACDELLAIFLERPGYGAIAAWPSLLTPQGATKPAKALIDTLRKSVDEEPTNFYRLNTLGAALIRSDEDAEGIKILDKARQFHNAVSSENLKKDEQGRPVDWLFLALAEHHRNQPARASQWFQLAKSGPPSSSDPGDLSKIRQTWNQFEITILLRELDATFRQTKSGSPQDAPVAPPPPAR